MQPKTLIALLAAFSAAQAAPALDKRQLIPGVNAALGNTVIPTVKGTLDTALNSAGSQVPQPAGGVVTSVAGAVQGATAPVTSQLGSVAGGAGAIADNGSPVGGGIDLKKRQLIPGVNAALGNTGGFILGFCKANGTLNPNSICIPLVIPTVKGTLDTTLNSAGSQVPQPVGGVVTSVASAVQGATDPVTSQLSSAASGVGAIADNGSPVGGGIDLKKRSTLHALRLRRRQLVPGVNAAVGNTVLPTVAGTVKTALGSGGSQLPQPVGGVVTTAAGAVSNGAEPVTSQLGSVTSGAGTIADNGSPVGGAIDLKRK
ncbi:hypothetical protein HDV00_001960 [Rhizophlyctis rosea]|nr:hypothetical protein HDV00_001960 [Rhizophlyctis rosea]